MQPIPTRVTAFTNQWRALQNVYNEYARQLGLTTSFIDVLFDLYEHQPCTQKSVMDRLFLPKQTVSFVVNKLRQKSYLTMQTDPADRRRNLLSLTTAGIEFAERVIAPFITCEDQAMGQLPPSEQQALSSLLAKFVKELNVSFGGQNEKAK
jgi:DNA-binding MarR family transcriptional regulator